MRWFVASEGSGQVVLDFLLRVALILIAELNAYASRSFTLRTFWCHPDDGACDRDFFVFAHQVQQHEHFVAQPIGTVGRNKQPTVDDIGHVREVQGTLVLDGQC